MLSPQLCRSWPAFARREGRDSHLVRTGGKARARSCRARSDRSRRRRGRAAGGRCHPPPAKATHLSGLLPRPAIGWRLLGDCRHRLDQTSEARAMPRGGTGPFFDPVPVCLAITRPEARSPIERDLVPARPAIRGRVFRLSRQRTRSSRSKHFSHGAQSFGCRGSSICTSLRSRSL